MKVVRARVFKFVTAPYGRVDFGFASCLAIEWGADIVEVLCQCKTIVVVLNPTAKNSLRADYTLAMGVMSTLCRSQQTG